KIGASVRALHTRSVAASHLNTPLLQGVPVGGIHIGLIYAQDKTFHHLSLHPVRVHITLNGAAAHGRLPPTRAVDGLCKLCGFPYFLSSRPPAKVKIPGGNITAGPPYSHAMNRCLLLTSLSLSAVSHVQS